MTGDNMGNIQKWMRSEAGMASFMVTTVLILVVGLIIIGFSQVARRNQRETLDRQLSTQAFYAAESGVNNAYAIIKDKLSRGQLPPAKDTCGADANYPAISLDSSAGVEVTCLLVDTEMDNLHYNGVTERSATIVPIISTGSNIASITFTWRPAMANGDPSSNCANGQFPTRGSWNCPHGVLRAEIASRPNDSNNMNAGMSTFFRPRHASLSPIPTMNSDSGLLTAACSDADGDPRCIARISGLNASEYYVNLRSIYKESTVTVSAQDAAGNDIALRGQAIIDVTAKAQDVLRRIQVRVPLKIGSKDTLPVYAIESTDSICKRFAVFPDDYYEDGMTCD